MRLTRKVEFEAAHYYRLAHLTAAENRARFGRVAEMHGHNYVLHVSVIGDVDAVTGMVVNVKHIDEVVRRRVVAQLDHQCLNLDVPAFREHLPTTENLALFVWRELEAAFDNCRLAAVRVYESDALLAEHRGERAPSGAEGERPMVYLTRAYEFSASHRLHEPGLSAEENARLYGKCNNANGHGHNYRVEVTVAGPTDEESGMVADLDALDRLVQAEVLDRFDYKHMNTDVEEFRTRNPTSENVVRFIYDRLAPRIAGGACLHRVRLYETPKSWFDCGEL
jgi:6-pyruvoyltetrahydropterin/6-carboxytetrahydropterin synthase